MGVSTKGVFHYTKDLGSLINILTIGFYPSYCKEIMIYGGERYSYAIPMVSFCDIPLSEIQYHTKKYGSFAIGLTRDWAKRNKLNPVLYIEKDSNLASGIKNMIDFMFLNWHEMLDDKDFDDFYKNVYKGGLNVIYSSKNYEGRLIRDEIDKDFNFYEEREWRYIPQISGDHINKYPDMFWEEDFADLNKRFTSKPHFKHHGTKIKAKDIKYIIIPDKSFLQRLINELKNIKNLFEDETEFIYLITNILTLDKIIEDI